MPYKGDLRYLRSEVKIDVDDIKHISATLGISYVDSKKLVVAEYNTSELQQFNGDYWETIEEEITELRWDVYDFINIHMLDK